MAPRHDERKRERDRHRAGVAGRRSVGVVARRVGPLGRRQRVPDRSGERPPPDRPGLRDRAGGRRSGSRRSSGPLAHR